MKNCTIIGISDSRKQWFPPEVAEVIAQGHIFSGGKRHHEIMKSYLPEGAVWIDITTPLTEVFNNYDNYEKIVIFASGDPLFYGFANTVRRERPDCKMKVYPAPNSLQLLAHRLQMPYHDLHAVSLTGRPWDKFDEALIHGEPLIGCLTDHNKTPHAIWQRMQDYGYTNYRMFVGEKLGNEEEEQVELYQQDKDYTTPNCLILEQTDKKHIPFGLPENQFHLLNGRTKMITKMPIRLTTLAALDLEERRSFWDIGFCTGSVSIEAKLRFPHLHITAFEIREEGRTLMDLNARKFGAPGIETHIGDFLKADLSSFTAPDAVFIGGHGGRITEMVSRIKQVIQPGGCIVFNSVSEESKRLFIDSITAVGMTAAIVATIQVDDHNPITILKGC